MAARLNTTIDQALPHLRPNHHLYLKSGAQMERLFAECPEAAVQHPCESRTSAVSTSAQTLAIPFPIRRYPKATPPQAT